MSFVEVQFPTDISYGSSGGPEYSTDVVMTQSGYEQRNVNWAAARARYNVAHGVKTQTQLDELIAFFRARKGRAYGFRFKDWMDYSAINQAVGVGDGSTTNYQLVKTYTSSGVTESRAVSKPVSGTISVYVDSVLQSSGVVIDTTTGMITFDSAPANEEVITADFEFDVPVRFDTDQLAARLDNYGAYSWLDIPLIEVRV